MYLADVLGLTVGDAARKALAHLLRKLARGEPLSPPAEVEAARRNIRRHQSSNAARAAGAPAPAGSRNP